jgi:tetratricopeptide (TPR) repeat protein
MHSRKLVFPVVFSLLVATSVQAGGKDTQRERVARKACLAGDYAKGVSILSDLFLDSKDATHIFNQGRCLEQNGRFEDAVFRFQEYLRVAADLNEADKEAARKHITDCQEQLAKRNGQPASDTAAPSAVVAPTVVQGPAQSQAVVEPPPPSILVQSNQPPVVESGSRIRTASIVTAGVGGAALLAGVVFNLKANSIASSYQDRGGYTQGKESDRTTYETFAWIGYGVGAACVATGALIYLFVRKGSARDSSTVAILPAFAPGEAGAVLKGAF